MPTTRGQLDALLTALRNHPVRSDRPISNEGFQFWDLFPAVDEADFSPALAGQADSWIWWSRWADEAFAPEGTLLRPALFHWRGAWPKIQLAAVQAGLVPRLEFTERYGASGVMVLCPSGRDQETDLSALLACFEALERDDEVVALPLAGWTQSDGWSDVAGAQRDPRQTAIFWHAQSHEAFDGLGMLSGTMHLYWRGDRRRLADALRSHGFIVETPTSVDVSFQLRSRRPAPRDIATVADARAFERPLAARAPLADASGLLSVERRDPAIGDGQPIEHLDWTADGALLVCNGYSARGLPTPPQLLDPDALTCRERLDDVGHGAMVLTLRALTSGRLLIGWSVYDDGTCFRLDERVPGGGLHTVLRYPVSHLGRGDVFDVCERDGVIVVPGQSTYQLRGLGEPGTRAKPARPGVVVRRKRPSTPGPWDTRHQRPYPGSNAYVSLALSPIAPHVAITEDGGRVVRVHDRERGAPLWHEDTSDQLSRAHGVRGLRYSPDGAWVVLMRRRTIERQDGSFVAAMQPVLLDASTGARRWRALETTLAGAHAITFSPAGDRIFAGMEDGAVLVLTRAGERVARLKAFRVGAVSALAIHEDRVAAGSDRGELCLLRLASA